MQRWLSVSKFFTVAIILLGVCSCNGFRLRGSFTIPSYLKTVYITPNDPYETLQRELRTRLKYYDVRIVEQPSPQVTTLHVTAPEFSEQILAYGSSLQVQRSKLTYTIRYELTTTEPEFNRSLTTISRSREFSKSNNQLLTNETEEQIVKKELLTEIINELLRQITSRPPKISVEHDSSTNDGNPC